MCAKARLFLNQLLKTLSGWQFFSVYIFPGEKKLLVTH